MNRIEEMIKRLCPKGVESVKLGDYIILYTGEQLNKANMFKIGSYPVINGGVSASGFVEAYNEQANTITISQGGASAGYVNFIKVPFWAGAHCFVIKPNSDNLNKRFLYHYIKGQEFFIQQCQQGAGIPSVNSDKIKKLLIPLPPLSIQQEIVSVLDSFTTLIDKMKKEVEMRKKQMECYREKIFDFEKKYETKTLGELFTFKNGINKEKKDFGIGKPIINYNDVYKKRGLYKKDIKGLVNSNDSEVARYKCKRGDVFFTRTSETKEEVGFPSVLLEDVEDCVFSGFVLRAAPTTNLLDVNYCKYCFFTEQFRKEVIKRSTLTTRALTNGNSLSKICMPLPPLSKQREIARTLDIFEEYIQRLEKLISLRQKQYEYYREKLLTFE